MLNSSNKKALGGDGKMTKIYTDTGQKIKTIEDWRNQLAHPEKNWAEGKSAYELACSWLNSEGDMPKSLLNLLNSSEVFNNLTIERAIVEKKVQFDNFGEPSHTDLMIYGRNERGNAVIAVEGKESEVFDQEVSKWITIKKEGSNKTARLENLLIKLNLDKLDKEDIYRIRYQLLHRTLSALIEAKKYEANQAMMLVHSFLSSDEEDHFNDYVYFCSLLGIERASIDRNKLIGPIILDNISLYFGWLRDKKWKFRN